MKHYFLLLILAISCVSYGQDTSATSFSSYSKFDFVPGEQVIFFDDFSQATVGDFPASWNTNGSGEIVTLNNFGGKWLKTSSEIRYRPVLNGKKFPDNYTIEFDVIFTAEEDMHGSTMLLSLDIFSAADAKAMEAEGATGVRLQAGGQGVGAYSWDNGTLGFENARDQNVLGEKNGKVIRFSAWVQKQRVRLYIGENKVYDLPQLMPSGGTVNAISFFTGIYGEGKRDILISNLRIAIGAPDMRNKLITEGKLVTRGILFDVNSDKLKAESYGTLKEIAQVLKDNPTVKVKIVGHTDSDGDDNANLSLSKKRAASVKNTLSKDFGVDAMRMETDGKGESEPASPNTTPLGKADNRRVEFIKL